MAAPSLYDDLPIDRSQLMLRLWRFDTSRSTTKHIQLELQCFPEDQQPEYIALSYTWGDLTSKKSIGINQAELRITDNLWDFLHAIRESRAFINRWFWADQISLNQADIDERNHQVALMGQIFSGAGQVFAWLGAYERIDAAYSKMLMLKDPLEMDEDSENVWKIAKKVVQRYAKSGGEIMTFVRWLAGREYWHRLWIIQELKLARSVVIYVGQCLIFGFELSPIVLYFRRGVTDGALRDALWHIEDLLQSTNIGRLPLFEALSISQNASCLDSRDKIFGIQALVEEPDRVKVDYSTSIGEIMAEALKILLPWLLDDIQFDLVKQDVERLRQIERSINSSGGGICYTLAWAYVLAKSSDALSDTYRVDHPRERWTRLQKVVQAYAYTEKQKLMAKDIVALACSKTDPEIKSLQKTNKFYIDIWQKVPISRVRKKAWMSMTLERKREVAEPAFLKQARVAERIVRRCAARHGFVMYGKFLSHPDDWPWPDEMPTRIFEEHD